MSTKIKKPVNKLTIPEFRKLQLEILTEFFGPPKDDDRRLIHGIPALSKALGLSIPIIKGWIRRNEIPVVKLSKRKFLFNLDEVLKAKEVAND